MSLAKVMNPIQLGITDISVSYEYIMLQKTVNLYNTEYLNCGDHECLYFASTLPLLLILQFPSTAGSTNSITPGSPLNMIAIDVAMVFSVLDVGAIEDCVFGGLKLGTSESSIDQVFKWVVHVRVFRSPAFI